MFKEDRGATPEGDEALGCFSEGLIEKVVDHGDGGWTVTFDGGWCCDAPAGDIEPKVGDVFRTYGRMGRPFHGQALNGTLLWYETIEEQDEKRRQMLADMDAKRRANFAANKEQLDRDYDGLPPLFKMRIDRFRKANPDFRWEYESYEMFTCTQAVLLAGWAAELEAPAQAIDEWNALPDKDQLEAIPGWSDGHSGNTHECAVALAKQYVTNRERVAIMPGAMSPLVGTADYSDRED